jgi:alpha-L-rhamnosidase
MTTRPPEPAPSALAPAGLRCAHLVNPLGVAPRRVRFSWLLSGAGTGRAQRAYQIQAAAGETLLASGRTWPGTAAADGVNLV